MNGDQPTPQDSSESSDLNKPSLQPLGPVEVAGANIVSTSSTTSQAGGGADLQSSNSGRYTYAYESDFLDNAVLSYPDDTPQPVLEIVQGIPKSEKRPGARKKKPLTATTESPEESALMVTPFIEMIQTDHADLDPIESSQVDKSAQDTATGFVDKSRGWRPTGTVFFETMATPPRGIIYRTREATNDGPVAALPAPMLNLTPDFTPPKTATGQSETRPRFEFPAHLVQPPVEDTQEIALPKKRRKFFRRYFKSFMIFTVGLLALAVFGVLGAAFAYYRYANARLYDSQLTGKAIVMTIEPGEAFNKVVSRLHDNKLLSSYMGINDKYLMTYLAKTQQNDHLVKPGAYAVDTGLSLSEIYKKMIEGSDDFKVTIPEGFTAQDVANEVKKKYPSFNEARFMELISQPEFIAANGINAPTLEGYLYPSTYYYGPGVKEEELVKLMVKAFHDKAASLPKPLPNTGLSFHEHVIMASLIEREARVDNDRPLIASVIFNRMKRGMPLQIDATVNYALGQWRTLTFDDYKIEHTYNTYKIKGLPPGPITSPRIESLAATFSPITSNYLYYVHKGDGHHAFAETYEEHLNNSERFIEKKGQLAENHGLNLGAAEESLPVRIIETPKPGAAGKPDSVPVVPQPKSY